MTLDNCTCESCQNEEHDLNAMNDLKSYLSENNIDEPIEGIVFGPWGWNGHYSCHDYDSPECSKRQNQIIPTSKMNTVLSEEEAQLYMDGWTFYNDYGYPATYASYIWTAHHIIWVTQNDGSTWLSSAPRNPARCVPTIK